jgi:hypothetical protein
LTFYAQIYYLFWLEKTKFLEVPPYIHSHSLLCNYNPVDPHLLVASTFSAFFDFSSLYSVFVDNFEPFPEFSSGKLSELVDMPFFVPYCPTPGMLDLMAQFEARTFWLGIDPMILYRK